MDALVSICLTFGSSLIRFHSARRTEALGGRLTWRLHTHESEVMRAAAALPSATSPWLSSPQIAGPLVLHFNNSRVVSCPGPFNVVACEPLLDGLELVLEQTVEDPEVAEDGKTSAAKAVVPHRQPMRLASHISQGGMDSWLNQGTLSRLLTTIDRETREEIRKAFGKQDSVILQIDQTAVQLAAWFAWVLSQSSTHPFWILGIVGRQWRLVWDDPALTEELQPDWRPASLYQQLKTADHPYLISEGRITRYSYVPVFQLDDVRDCVTQMYLPRRLAVSERDTRWGVARHDLFSEGSVPWHVELDFADRSPMPTWSPPRFPGGKLLGTIAEDWSSGPSVKCKLDGCEAAIPVRLTTFDTGNESLVGWQWVPTRGNRVCIDPCWTLGDLPAIRYVERHVGVSEPYVMQLPEKKRWLAKIGNVAIKFFRRGLRID